jgi:hypothetical protein
MNGGDVLYWFIMALLSIIVIWIVFSLTLLWLKPNFYKEDDKGCRTINWWTTLWVTLICIFFVWLVNVIVTWIFQWAKGSNECCNTCNRSAGFQVNLY